MQIDPLTFRNLSVNFTHFIHANLSVNFPQFIYNLSAAALDPDIVGTAAKVEVKNPLEDEILMKFLKQDSEHDQDQDQNQEEEVQQVAEKCFFN
jgi:hypothetical protein